jgi:hypothetical protein
MFNISSSNGSSIISVNSSFKAKATSNHGFHIYLPNGYKVSVQWGGGTYSDNHDSWDFSDISMKSNTAEVAVINPDGDLIETPFNPHDTVIGWQSTEDVMTIVRWASQLPYILEE